ncbi:RagB/SusD family nutrient uptake outer membrane protein [Pseudozobellia sp. WGM2]|uniref:RagB/SusD family nutrient uptake outer membrane protein n=1 Tax=Pseudozobellia sp. WGM2 TaxID=2787625 RepID=UPI001ADFF8D4|nr:RagB/SusD family nutrient uptake outer membrane protein [Pseudozobellia sp. WGM2]
MNKLYIYLFGFLLFGLLPSCNHDDWFEREPQNIIVDEQLWNDPELIKSLLANYYNRLPSLHGVFNVGGMSEIDDAMYSGHFDQNWRNDFEYGDDYGRYWDYSFIRDINLALDNLDNYSKDLDEEQVALFKAELRFIRAFVYFELVKRMGGVPLVTEQLIYDFNGDPTNLQVPRSKEYEVYDFIFNELESIKTDLAANNNSKTRANLYIALALESRAMLYAGSLAKYNSLMASPITLSGEEVGIPANLADGYYQKSLNASLEIINSGRYSLYEANSNKELNFYEALINKDNNPETIFAKDYASELKEHWYTFENVPRSLMEDNEGSSILSPSLNLVESFDYLDGSDGALNYIDGTGNYIVYDNMTDIYNNKDARLWGTVVLPGTAIRGSNVNVQAGVAVWNGTAYELQNAPNLGDNFSDGKLWTGFDGPQDNAQFVSNTGFYTRKFISNKPGEALRNNSTNWWPWFRLGEIYLNASEAAFELGRESLALEYINLIRSRAGFPENSLTQLTLTDFQKERRHELAYEDHRYFDLKRWRLAHEIWDGNQESEEAVVYGLYPYRIVNPGHEDDSKFIYVKTRPTRFRRARFFRLANYYASIDPNVLNNNPKLVRNPYH